MAVIHISEAEALRDPSSLFAKARAGEHIVVDGETESFSIARWISPLAGLLDSEVNPPLRTLSEAIRLAEERNSSVTLDDEFSNDLEEIIATHQSETLIDPWESF